MLLRLNSNNGIGSRWEPSQDVPERRRASVYSPIFRTVTLLLQPHFNLIIASSTYQAGNWSGGSSSGNFKNVWENRQFWHFWQALVQCNSIFMGGFSAVTLLQGGAGMAVIIAAVAFQVVTAGCGNPLTVTNCYKLLHHCYTAVTLHCYSFILLKSNSYKICNSNHPKRSISPRIFKKWLATMTFCHLCSGGFR